jgi:chromosome segregation ATPase
MLRLRLSANEQELEEAKAECARLNDNQENVQRQDDIDRLSLQHELVELKRKSNEYRVKAEQAEGTLGSLQDSHDEAMKLIQKLTSELKSERLKTVELQHDLKQAGNHKKTEKDLLTIIDDLRAEIRLLEEEQARLMETRFGAVRDEQYQEEMQKLQKRITELEQQIAGHLKDKAELSAALQTMAGTANIFLSYLSEEILNKYRATQDCSRRKVCY